MNHNPNIQMAVQVDGETTVGPEAFIPVSDRGFLFGDALFETMVAFDGKLLDFDEHLARLRASAEELKMAVPWTNERLRFETEGLLQVVRSEKVAIRLIVTRGSGWTLPYDPGQTPRRIIICRTADPVPGRFLSEGIALKRKGLPYTERGAAPKTLNYVRSALALDEALRAGFDDVVWSNSEGEVTEATTANIFFVGRHGEQGEIVTPPAHAGILPGITRGRVIELLKKTGADIKEATVFVDEIPRFDEAFLTSTVRGLIPVSRIDQHRFRSARASSFFRALHGAFLRTTWERLGLMARIH